MIKRGMPRATSVCVLAATAVGGAFIAPSASAATASSCTSSALELSLLGGAASSAISAGSSPCTTDRGAVDLAALGSVQATAVEAATLGGSNRTPGSAARVAGLSLGVGGITKQLTAPLLSGPNSLVSQITSQLGSAASPSGSLAVSLPRWPPSASR